MAPLIRRVLSNLIGDKEASEIEIISNHVDIEPNGKWHIKFRHPSRSVNPSSPLSDLLTFVFTSGYGHDKSQAILPYRNLPEPPILFFFGDGVSGQVNPLQDLYI